MGVASGRWVRAVSDHLAASHEELSFFAGDLIAVTQRYAVRRDGGGRSIYVRAWPPVATVTR